MTHSLADLTDQLRAARDKIQELNRRCQSAESGLAQRLEDNGGRSLGRSLANAGYRMQERRIAELEADLSSLRLQLGERAKPAPLLGITIKVNPAMPPDEVRLYQGDVLAHVFKVDSALPAVEEARDG